MEKGKLSLMNWSRKFFLILVIVAIFCPNLVWGQSDPGVPIELKVKLNDAKIKIGQIFVEELKKQISRSKKFVISNVDVPRIIIRVDSQGIVDLPYQSVVSVIWSAALPGKGTPKEIFLHYMVMVGVSAAHAGKDAEDILNNYTQKEILPRFTVIKEEK